MNSEELHKMKDRIWSGLDMVMEKAEKIGRAKTEWSIMELGEMADIEKDMAKALKCLVKTEVLMNEHSVDKY
jgi:hypothetical protein